MRDEQARRFFEDGFIVLRDVFTRTEVAAIGVAFDRLRRTAGRLGRSRMHRGSRYVLGPGRGGEVRIDRVVWCASSDGDLDRIGRDPRLLAPAARLLGTPTMHQLISQAHFKLPGDGVAFPWHQDSRHRRHGTPLWRDVNGRGSYVQTIIAVDEATEDNGPLMMVPGTPGLGHIDRGDGSLPNLVDVDRAVPVLMRPGDVAMFGPYTVHGSRPNRSGRPRRVFINGFAHHRANSRVYPGRGAGREIRCLL